MSLRFLTHLLSNFGKAFSTFFLMITCETGNVEENHMLLHYFFMHALPFYLLARNAKLLVVKRRIRDPLSYGGGQRATQITIRARGHQKRLSFSLFLLTSRTLHHHIIL